MSGSLDLEQRYRRVLRLLPGYYRDKWEQDMVAAFLDSWPTRGPEEDEYITKAARPSWAEIASVAGLAVRLYLGGAGTPHRYFAWGQAVRRAVLAVTLLQAVRGLDMLVRTAWSRHMLGWLPAPPASMVPATPAGILPPVAWYLVAYAWIVSLVALVLGHYRTAQVIAALAIVPDLVWLLQGEFIGAFRGPSVGPWAFWVLINLAPVLAMAAFHRDAPSAARWPWLLALPAGYLVVAMPPLAIQASGNSVWIPDFSGLYCLLVALACLALAPRARSRRSAGSGLWSLALTLLAADAGAYRIFSLTDYLHNPHLIDVSLGELLILAAAVALVLPNATRAQTATPAPPPRPHPG
ncbi:MAG TPA: hypothetical protein VG142_10675 [Trebonia sp.]|jgi:hypothetical protein|nr:hypothetical protein [Trebonia sp.]